MKIAAVIVLYNPDSDLAENINSYIEDVDWIYIIDNSSKDNEILFKEKLNDSNKYTYKPLFRNYGLARALNIGCDLAIDNGYDYILTMDQDSRFDNDAVRIMKRYTLDDKYAIIAPNVKSLYFDEKSNSERTAYIRLKKSERKTPNWVMTSGCLMKSIEYVNAGRFDEKMFIAHIDCDICYRISLNGGKILQVGDAIINQHFGNSKPKNILWKTVHPSYASPVRTYYLFRNQKYMQSKYGNIVNEFLGVKLWKFVVKILLFEPQKIEKMKMAIRGIQDASQGRMGEYC